MLVNSDPAFHGEMKGEESSEIKGYLSMGRRDVCEKNRLKKGRAVQNAPLPKIELALAAVQSSPVPANEHLCQVSPTRTWLILTIKPGWLFANPAVAEDRISLRGSRAPLETEEFAPHRLRRIRCNFFLLKES